MFSIISSSTWETKAKKAGIAPHRSRWYPQNRAFHSLEMCQLPLVLLTYLHWSRFLPILTSALQHLNHFSYQCGISVGVFQKTLTFLSQIIAVADVFVIPSVCVGRFLAVQQWCWPYCQNNSKMTRLIEFLKCMLLLEKPDIKRGMLIIFTS